jgi:hypothetical protein
VIKLVLVETTQEKNVKLNCMHLAFRFPRELRLRLKDYHEMEEAKGRGGIELLSKS